MDVIGHPVRIFLTHPPEALANWYGERALSELGTVAEVVLNPKDREISPTELVAAAQGCAIIIADRQTPGEAVLFGALPDLVAFSRVGVDIRNVDVAAASAAGVLVTQASRGFMAAVAEWIIGAMIAACRHIPSYAEAYKRGEEPASVLGRQLDGSTLGVIGYGAIAAHLCDIAVAVGMRVVVADPYKQVDPPLRQTDMVTLLAESDFVVPLANATAETENLIDEAALARMKPTAWLVNASRGNLVDETALARALDERRIAGAALDVGRAPDQKPSPHLTARPNVIATPHIAGLTRESVEHQSLETCGRRRRSSAARSPLARSMPSIATRFGRFRQRMREGTDG